MVKHMTKPNLKCVLKTRSRNNNSMHRFMINDKKRDNIRGHECF